MIGGPWIDLGGPWIDFADPGLTSAGPGSTSRPRLEGSSRIRQSYGGYSVPDTKFIGNVEVYWHRTGSLSTAHEEERNQE
jgi:hypothetical protein